MTPAQVRARYRTAFEMNPETATITRGATAATDVLVRDLGAVADANDVLTMTLDRPMLRILILAEDLDDQAFPVPPRRDDEVTMRGRDWRVEKLLDGRAIGGVYVAYPVILVL